jgi:hypothetical protein
MLPSRDGVYGEETVVLKNYSQKENDTDKAGLMS